MTNKENLTEKIEKNKQLLSSLVTKKTRLEEQIFNLQKKIQNQENALLNLPEKEEKE